MVGSCKMQKIKICWVCVKIQLLVKYLAQPLAQSKMLNHQLIFIECLLWEQHSSGICRQNNEQEKDGFCFHGSYMQHRKKTGKNKCNPSGRFDHMLGWQL